MTSTSAIYNPSRIYEVAVRDVEYLRDGDRTWLARVYQPQGPGPFPALLEIHGGAWNNGDRTNNPAIAEGLSASGVVVASIDFRMGGADPYPSSLIDINYATRWLKAHAGEFAADPATVGGLGVSSGGHLIMLSAMRPHDPRYAARPLPDASATDATLAYVITCWGVLDSYGRYLMARERGNEELIGNHDRYFVTVDAMQEGNPLLALQRGEKLTLPPALLIQGTADAGVPKGMAENFVSLYAAAGGAIEPAMFQDMPHGIAGWPEPQVKQMIDRIKAFIARSIAPVANAR